MEENKDLEMNEETTQAAEEVAEDAKETVEGFVEDAKETFQGFVEDAKEAVEDTVEDVAIWLITTANGKKMLRDAVGVTT